MAWVLAFFCLSGLLVHGAESTAPVKSGDFYQTAKVWNFHFKFTANQWAALEPIRKQRQFPFGGPGGPGGPDGPNLRAEDAKRNGLAGVIGIDFEYSRGDVEWDGGSLHDAAIRYKGNGTYMFSQMALKRPFKVDLNKHVKGQKLAGASKLNFANNVADSTFLSDALSYELYREAEVPSPRTTYARLNVTVPDKHDKRYFGLYTLVENVDDNFAQERFGSRKGAIFKPVTPRLFDDLGDNWAAYEKTYDPKDKITPQQKQRVIEMSRLVTKATDEEFKEKISGLLDMDQFARYMAVTVFLSTYDSILAMGQNYYLYLHPTSNKFQFIPWDLDHSFGEFPMIGTPESRRDASIDHPWVGQNRLLERVMALPEFQKPYHDYLAKFLTTIFRAEKISRRMDEVAASIRDAVREESPEKLEKFEQALSSQPAKSEGNEGGGMPFFGGPPNQIKVYVVARAKSISDQLAGKSKGTKVERGMMMRGGPRPPR